MHTHVLMDTHVCIHTHRHAAHSLTHLDSKSATKVSVITVPHCQMLELALRRIQKNSVQLNFGVREAIWRKNFSTEKYMMYVTECVLYVRT